MAFKHHNTLPFTGSSSSNVTTSTIAEAASQPPPLIDASTYDSHVFEFDVVELEVNETIKQLLTEVENSLLASEEQLQNSATILNSTSTPTLPPETTNLPSTAVCEEAVTIPSPPPIETKCVETQSNIHQTQHIISSESLDNTPKHDLIQDSKLNLNESSHNNPEPYDSSPDEATCDLVIDSSIPSIEPQDSVNQPDTSTSSMDVEPGTFIIEDQNSIQLDKSQSTNIAKNLDDAIEPSQKSMEVNTGAQSPAPCTSGASVSEHTGSSIDSNEQTEKKVKEESTKPVPSDTQVRPNELIQELDDEVTKETANKEVTKLLDKVGETDQIAAILDDDMRESPEEKVKEMVVLRNLEISPPPQPLQQQQQSNDKEKQDETTTSETGSTKSDNKRKRTTKNDSPPRLNEGNETSGRAKRQRTQTKLFQIGTTSPIDDLSTSLTNSTSSKKSTSKSTTKRRKSTNLSTSVSNFPTAQDSIQPAITDQPDVIYDKNDCLAVRNEEDSFFLCQLTESVKIRRPFFKIRWLDTKDNGKTYFLTSQYDKVPQESIIMPVVLDKIKSDKKGEQTFTISDQVKEMIMDRLKRSLNLYPECTSSQDLSTCSQSTS